MTTTITSATVLVTPRMAESWLKRNPKNRALSKNHVEFLVGVIKRNEWKENGETISFFKNGDLADGQHRLAAIVKSGISLEILVVQGLDPNSFSTINQGKRRSSADILSIAGELNYTKLATGARAYVAYFLSGRAEKDITSTQINACVDAHPELRLWVARIVGNKTLKKFPGSIVGLATIASERYGTSIVDQFFDQLSSGIGLEAGSPSLLLRERLLNQGNTKLTKDTQNAFIVKALNAHIKGKKLSFLRWSQGEDFPVLV